MLIEQARQTWNDVANLLSDVCPDNLAQLSLTMHPQFSSSTDIPTLFLEEANLTLIGERPVQCYPRELADETSDSARNTSALIVVGTRPDIQKLPHYLEMLDSKTPVSKQMRTIESIEAVSVYDKLDVPNDYFGSYFLVGVYEAPGKSMQDTKDMFSSFVQNQNFKVHPFFLLPKNGIFYVIIKGERYNLDSVAEYALVSSVRAANLE